MQSVQYLAGIIALGWKPVPGHCPGEGEAVVVGLVVEAGQAEAGQAEAGIGDARVFEGGPSLDHTGGQDKAFERKYSGEPAGSHTHYCCCYYYY